MIIGKWEVESGKRKVDSGKLDGITFFYTNITWREKFIAFGTRFTPLRFRSGPPKVGLPCGMAPTGRKWENPLCKWKVENGEWKTDCHSE